MIKAVLFDLDGTLLNTTDGILESVRFAAQQLGYPELPYETMLKFVGPPIQNSFKKFYGASEERAQEAANVFRTYYKMNALFRATLYPEMIEVLQELKDGGVKIAVATYKREDYAISILEYFGIASFCQSMHGADNFNKLTKADIVNLCIGELGVDKTEVVLVGDTEHDALGAQIANVNFIGVTYGFGFNTLEEVNAFPNIGCAGSPKEILKYI